MFMLAAELQEHGFRVVHADSDADLLIVKTALQVAETSITTIIGEDTYLLFIVLVEIV